MQTEKDRNKYEQIQRLRVREDDLFSDFLIIGSDGSKCLECSHLQCIAPVHRLHISMYCHDMLERKSMKNFY